MKLVETKESAFRTGRIRQSCCSTELFEYKLLSIAPGETLNAEFADSFNLLLVVSGDLSIETPYGTNALLPGCMLVLDKVRFSVENTQPVNDALVLSFGFSQKMLQRFKQRYSEIMTKGKVGEVTLSKQKKLPLLFSGCDLTRMAITSLSLLMQNTFEESLLALKLEELLLLQSGKSQSNLLAQQILTLCDSSTARFREYVEVNYLNDWPLDKFAKNYAVSLTAFKSLFNRVYKTSPRAWINEQRLRYADQLLRTNNMRIIDVAVTAGFSSQSYFSQAYKTRFGISPIKVRKAG